MSSISFPGGKVARLASFHLASAASSFLAVLCLCLRCAAADGDPVPPDLPSDPTVWPNLTSHRNSDPWLWQHHDEIRKMRPRVLVLNFANNVDMDGIRERTRNLIGALAEGTRHHGFKDPSAPAFLEYDVVRHVDLRDEHPAEDRKHDNSSLFPVKPNASAEVLCDYGRLYGSEFAARFGFPDPRQPGRFLDLHELVNLGFVHELWFYAIHGDRWPGNETIECKQYYDERCHPLEGKHGPAGNGHDPTFPWSGRSFRIAFFNPHRGIGCAMENFGHTLEYMAHWGAIGLLPEVLPGVCRARPDRAIRPALRVPVRALGRGCGVLPDEGRDGHPQGRGRAQDLALRGAGRERPFPSRRAEPLRPGQPPYGAQHDRGVDGCAEGEAGKDTVSEFSKEKWAPYLSVAPDCMGAWTVFWRQCMPGLDNRALDDDGKPMKNWWVFLFY